MSAETEVKPGLYRGVSFDDYAEWDAANASKLNTFKRTPAHVYYEMLHGGKKSTPQMDLGWLVHLAVLEPERFKGETIVPPKVDKRTKAGKEMWAEFGAEHAGKTFVDSLTMEKVSAMARNVLAHETASEFFGGAGQNEISILWEDTKAGVLCKARMDRVSTIGEWPIVGDLKTAHNASRREFERSVHNFGYHVQAAHYLAGLEALYPIPDGNPFRRFVFPVVESEPPYLCAVYELDDAAIEEGVQKREKYLAQWKECVTSGVWPGYAPGVDYCSLPAWAFKYYED